jgi:DNA topoisomerase VI subunit B
MPPRSLAEELASKQKAISVAEFFERNRQILGFDNTLRATLTTVKEGCDNSLDATEEARILPEVVVEIQKLAEDKFKIIVEDNGPGIVRKQLPNVFGRLLYGSRFHANRQARGQQGIGISAAVLYAGLTTGTPTHVVSKVKEDPAANVLDLLIDTAKNQARIVKEGVQAWDRENGTRLEITIKGRYQRGRQSPYEYLRGCAIVNPHAKITLVEPDGTRITWERASSELPPLSKEVPPHPHGLELGELDNLLRRSSSKSIIAFLSDDLSCVSRRAAGEILATAQLTGREVPGTISAEKVARLHEALRSTSLPAPSAESLSPIGPMLIKRGLKNVLGALRPDFYSPPITRPPKVHSGCPFVVEVGLVYGGELPADQPIQLLRFANRVPLLFQQGACSITNTVASMDWRRYGLEQKSGALPTGPVILLVHVASTKVPFTSEAKEAVAETDEICREIELAVQGAARNMKLHLSRQVRKGQAQEKFRIIQRILPKLAEKTSGLVEKPVPDLTRVITRIMDVVAVEVKGSGEDPEKPSKRTTITLTNYTARIRPIEVFLELPLDAVKEGFKADPAPDSVQQEMGRVTFGVTKLSPNARAEFVLDWPSGEELEADDVDIFVAGVDEAHLLGADPLPGDWDVRLPPALVEAAEEEAMAKEKGLTPGEEEEVDYDAAERKGSVASDEE